jgi:Tfp pilus assembly protein PilF
MNSSLQKRAEEAEEAEDLPVALGLWKQLAASNSQDDFFFVRYGSVAQKLERWAEAEQAFSDALRLAPTSPLIMENLGSLWAHRTDKGEVESFEVAKRWFLEALKYECHARLLTQLGATYVALNDEESARQAFEAALRITPNYEEALYNLAVLDEKNDPERSMALLERAIEIDPNYAEAHQVLGRLFQRAGDLTRADYHFRRSLDIDPADYWSNLYLANLLGVQGKNDEAEQMYRLATSLHPEIAGGIDLYAKFLESIGKADEAAAVRKSTRPPES